MGFLLVIEVKGQWRKELFTAASEQLMDRYSIHPDAAGQGIFLVFWFGDEGDSIAGKVDPAISTAEQLNRAILGQMSEELKAVIDVVVLDVSRPATVAKPPKKKRAAKCSIPSHCIAPRRLPLFIARSALRDLITGLHADAKGVQAA